MKLKTTWMMKTTFRLKNGFDEVGGDESDDENNISTEKQF